MNLAEAEKIAQEMDDDARQPQAYALILRHAEDYVDPQHLPLTDGERGTIADAVCNQEDCEDALEEYRFWRSPHGRKVEAYESFESGRY